MTTGNFEYPDYSDIQEYIREARLERSIAIANLIADGVDAAWRGLQAVATAIVRFVKAVPDARAVEAQAYMHRAAHH